MALAPIKKSEVIAHATNTVLKITHNLFKLSLKRSNLQINTNSGMIDAYRKITINRGNIDFIILLNKLFHNQISILLCNIWVKELKLNPLSNLLLTI